MREVYQMTKEELFEMLSIEEKGLTVKEANNRLEQYGKNRLEGVKRKGAIRIFLEQFMDLLVVILMIAAVISMISGNVESTVVIFVVLILNAILGTVQYLKAEKSLDSLKALSSPKAKVLRDGTKQEILSHEIVPGDLLILEAGDMVVADGRILNNFSLQVNESSLTGESTNVDKSESDIMKEVPLADRINMVYAGTLVTYGRAEVLVTGTGMKTEIGKIAELMNCTKEKKTPLQQSLDQFSKKLAIFIILICIIVFGLQLIQGTTWIDSLMFAVALAVAAIPEALSSIVTIVQAIGTQKMAEDNAIIKELKAVESLGCVSVICSDKTGTLTQNKMTVTDIYAEEKCMKPEALNICSEAQRYLLYNAILNNDSVILEDQAVGDPTEVCLLEMVQKASDGKKRLGKTIQAQIRSMMQRMEELPFDSERKCMSTKYRIHGVPTVLTKGAVDVLLDKIVNIHTQDGVRPITEKDKEDIIAQNDSFSGNGLRVLAFAYKEMEEEENLTFAAEDEFTFVGLVAMIDPPREESAKAVAEAKEAGIKTIMITGDHKVTATAIAQKIGIFEAGDRTITGLELDAMTEQELEDALNKISVYARVSPENKIRIVDAWQRRNCIVAMTGDGVNDAPALKKADVGVAMGITGTEVSKDASAMILSDDNFATIIKAVLNGRNVYRNIKNAIQFLLSGNMAGILAVAYCCLMNLPAPFAPVHLLFINLVTDSLPALAIGMEAGDKNLLKEKPRDAKTGILTRGFILHLLGYGGLIAVATVIAYHVGLQEGVAMAGTMAFATLTLARLFHGFNCRSDRAIFRVGIFGNRWSVAAFLLGILLLSCVLFLPFLQKMFVVETLSGMQLLLIVCLAFFPTFFVQCKRLFKKD